MRLDRSCCSFALGALGVLGVLAAVAAGDGSMLRAQTATPAVPAAPGTVEIRIHTAGGVERYLALVPEDRPWSEPLREAVLRPSESTVTWPAPAGRYRVVCAATRHEILFLPAFGLTSGDHHDVECSPAPLAANTGQLLSAADRQPIAGARIGRVHAFLRDFSLKLGELGEQLTRPDRSTLSAADGSFRVLGHAGGRESLWIEAAGWSPGFLEGVLFPPGGGRLGAVALERGVALTAPVAPPPAGFPADRYLVVLRQSGAGPEQGERYFLSQRIWERPLAAGPLQWASLPPGTYTLLLKPRNAGELPLALATTALAAGETVTLRVAVPPEAVARRPPPAAPSGAAGLRLLAAGSGDEDLQVLRFDGSKVATAPAAWKPVAGGRLAVIAAGCRAGWSYWLRGKDRISTAVEVGDGCGLTAPVELHPAAAVRGRMVAPAAAAPPAAARLAAVLCERMPGGSRVPLGRYPFAVASDGSWSVELPAGCRDLAVEAPGFAPVVYQHQAASPGGLADLGVQRLSRGASLLTRILSDEGAPLAGAAVELFPAGEVAKLAAATLARNELPAVASARSGRGGWVRLHDLPEGQFVLRVAAPGRAPSFSNPFELRAQLELPLDDVYLPAPATLRVALRPADELVALASSFTATVTGIAPPAWIEGASFQLSAGAGRTVEFAQLAPGTWRVSGWAKTAQGTFLLQQQVVGLTAGPTSLELELEGKIYHGRVTRHEQPLHAVVDLRPVPHDGRGAVHFTTGEDGSFAVPLAAGGTYSAMVRERQGPGGAAVPEVRFEDPAVPVEIRLPEGQIGGLVVDGDDKPLPEAAVSAQLAVEGPPPAGAATGDLSQILRDTRSGGGGEFTFDGLGAGRWMLSARLGELRSDLVAVDLVEAIPRQGVKLTVRDRERIPGHVVGPDGRPVAGARVAIAYPPGSDAVWPRYATAATEADGSFTVERLAPPEAVVNVAVAAAGLPVATWRRPLGPGAFELQLAGAGGGVEITLGSGSWHEVPPDQLVLVADDGSFVGCGTAGAAMEPSRLVIGSLAPGHWSLVRIHSIAAETAVVLGAGRGLAPLGAFDVVPGRTAQAQVTKLRR
jgi:hypothetical protein